MKNIELKDIPAKLTPFLEFLKRYTVLIFILSFLGLYGFLVLRINALSQLEPDEDTVLERIGSIKKPEIDHKAIERIKLLQEQSIEVEALFQQARDNPFTEPQ